VLGELRIGPYTYVDREDYTLHLRGNTVKGRERVSRGFEGTSDEKELARVSTRRRRR